MFDEIRFWADQDAFLDQRCAANPTLRRRVEELLAAHQEAGSGFLAQATMPPQATPGQLGETTAPISEQPGSKVGSYKLLQQIGEGGMGTVFLAEQTEPVRRQVALKIVKPGMDSGQVIARFEAERQALALMDHPNIARVLEAGTTDAGRPYCVMELVKGISITEFCDRQRLPPSERIQLMLPVCEAVQHAHQKGIIHRDLKPSNVLVAMYDDRPVPKVIDFGIAKATGELLTEKTLFTNFGQVVGTLEYMSPEQAQLNQLGIDTRSDVYALGVMLYELLWDIATKKEVHRLTGHRSYVNGIAFSADGRRVVTLGFHTAKLWDVDTGHEILSWEIEGGDRAVFDEQNQQLAIMGSDMGVVLDGSYNAQLGAVSDD